MSILATNLNTCFALALLGLPGGALFSTVVVAGSLVVCVGLFALSRTAWGRARPMHRYAAASLAAHLVLLAAATTVRYGDASHGDDEAPPVKVRIVMRAPPVTELVEDVAETKPTEPEVIAERLDPKEPVAEPEAAAVIEVAESTVEALPEALSKPTEAPGPDTSLLAEAPFAQTPEPLPSQQEATPISAPVSATPFPLPPSPFVSPSVVSAYSTRGQRQRRQLAIEQGGSDATEDAVTRGVDWLVLAQRPDGAWDAARWGAGRERRVLDHDRRGAGGHAETGLTGLALLALQGAGQTHLEGAYPECVTAGLAYLLDQQKPDGDLSGSATTYARTYCHSMATFALAEALATTDDDRLKPGVERAVGYLLRGQSPTTGGWRYRPGDRGDMSQMGWVVMALRSAELAGIDVPPRAWKGIEQFVQSVARGQHGGLAAYQPRGAVSATMTAEALYCRQILGFSRGQSHRASESVMHLTTRLPTTSAATNRPVNLYYWYYATLALHHHRQADLEADQAWSLWNESMTRSLLPLQVTQGVNSGSWSPTTLWGGYGGRVYATSLAVMCLEVYYRYDEEQLGRDPWLMAREAAPLLR